MDVDDDMAMTACVISVVWTHRGSDVTLFARSFTSRGDELANVLADPTGCLLHRRSECPGVCQPECAHTDSA
jgi:hypothetical protein